MLELSSEDQIRLEKLLEITAPFKALLYDVDGTLADNMSAHTAAYMEAGRRHGVEMDPELIVETAGWPTVKVAKEISVRYNKEFDPQTFANIKSKIFIEEFVHQTLPIKFVYSHLINNKDQKRIALVSGGRRSTLQHTLKAIGVEGNYEFLVCADDTEKGKPHPDPFLKAAQLLGVAPEDCIVLEDGDPGVQGAIKAGMGWVRIDQL